MFHWIVSGILFAGAAYGIYRIAKANGLFGSSAPVSVTGSKGAAGSGSAPVSKPK